MDLSVFFRPLNEEEIRSREYNTRSFGNNIRIHTGGFPQWEDCDIVMIGCDEDKGSFGSIKGCGLAPEIIRKYLYKFSMPKETMKIVDLGNIQKKDRLSEYYDAIAFVTGFLLREGKKVILIGGSNDIAYGQYLGYEKFNHEISYVSVDNRFDMDDSDFGINNRTYNHKIFLHSPNFLYHYTNLGHQSYYVSDVEKKAMKSMNFEAIRLGLLKEDITISEPVMRDADLVSFDLSSVRHADAPGTNHPSPPGFFAEEMCQLSRYAGVSNKVSSVSFCEVNPVKDLNEITSHLTAQMIWYFIEGFYSRRNDMPNHERSNVQKISTPIRGGIEEIVFYHSEISDRWWMEVPGNHALKNLNGNGKEQRKLISCSRTDFELAANDEIPERWWLTHLKMK
jgi:arginase family enzyme